MHVYADRGAECMQLPEVHKEIFRVLKPGGAYVSQEWVTTPLYDDANAEHKRIIEEINFGNSLPNMRSWSEAEASGKSVRSRQPAPRSLSYQCVQDSSAGAIGCVYSGMVAVRWHGCCQVLACDTKPYSNSHAAAL